MYDAAAQQLIDHLTLFLAKGKGDKISQWYILQHMFVLLETASAKVFKNKDTLQKILQQLINLVALWHQQKMIDDLTIIGYLENGLRLARFFRLDNEKEKLLQIRTQFEQNEKKAAELTLATETLTAVEKTALEDDIRWLQLVAQLIRQKIEKPEAKFSVQPVKAALTRGMAFVARYPRSPSIINTYLNRLVAIAKEYGLQEITTDAEQRSREFEMMASPFLEQDDEMTPSSLGSMPEPTVDPQEEKKINFLFCLLEPSWNKEQADALLQWMLPIMQTVSAHDINTARGCLELSIWLAEQYDLSQMKYDLTMVQSDLLSQGRKSEGAEPIEALPPFKNILALLKNY